VYLYKKRWLLVINFLIACTAAAVYAFVIMDREYSATVTFLPPSGDNISAMSLLNLSMPSLSSGGASADQIEILFNSNAIKRRIVDEFNLIEFFKLEDSPNQFGLASRFMGKYVMMRTGEKGGMGMSRTISYAISCYHRSPDTAKLMADFTFAIIDSAVREISISRAQRNREFIEAQIVIQNEKMDSLQAVFQEFQHTNKAFNIPEQTRLTLKAYADLQAAAVMNELRLAALRREFTGQTHEIAELRRLQRVYQEKLGEYESGENPAVIPSLELSSRLFPEYAKMMRDIEVQNQLTLFLTKELEQARLQEARDVSPLIIVDPPFIPEYKARPKRLLIILVIVFAQNLLILGLLAHTFALKTAHRSGKFDSFLKSIKQD
jgi:capsule polysaccharide export protein KpsE/RkpR